MAKVVASLRVDGRTYRVYGSEEHGYLVHPQPLAADPSREHGGYAPATGDSLPFAGIDRSDGAGPAWGIWPPLGTKPLWYVYDAYTTRPRKEALLGFAQTSSEAWDLAARSLERMINARFALAARGMQS
jgi:hypothetical protein